MPTNEQIDRIIGECIPLPRSCKLEIQRAERRREKMKTWILENIVNLAQSVSNESVGIRAEKDTESASAFSG